MLHHHTFWTVLEWTGAFFNVASSIGGYRAKVWCWPATIISSLCYGVLFGHLTLYGEMSLQVYGVVMAIAGWRAWAVGGPAGIGIPITALTWRRRLWITGGVTFVSAAAALSLRAFTDASHPVADSLVTIGSIVAQYLMVRKKVDSWIAWNAVNALSIWLYLVKGIPTTAATYVFFFVFNCFAFRAWRGRLLQGRG